MANFKTAYLLTMKHEGGYANNAIDKGGETYKGISRKNWPGWVGWKIIDQIKAQSRATGQALAAFINTVGGANASLQSLVLDFFKVNFWDINKLDAVQNQLIANEVFDTGVNAGTGTGARFLQEALNLCNRNATVYPDIDVDGKIGPVTLNVLNTRAPVVAVLNTLNMLQGEHYLNIMRLNKTQEAFWPSWLSRTVVDGRW